MPSTTKPPVPHYESVPATQEPLEFADLAIIDISKAKTPEGRQELAPLVRDAMRTHGFLYIVNHGLTQAERDRVTDIADVPLSHVPDEEKAKFVSKMKEEGVYRGYKPREFWTIDNGVRDQIETYNMYRLIYNQEHPKALQPYLPELRAFAEHNHYNVLHPILRLLALGLELPEETFVELHNFEGENETYLRSMKYFPRTEEDEIKTKNVWLKGHTDIGTITLLWCQPVTGLQIMSPDKKWRYVKQIPNAIIANVGDSMEWMSGGYYKATIHRVFQPPIDQRGYSRLSLIYFASGDNDVRIVPMKNSPVLQRVGITRKFADEDAPTMAEWRRARTKAYGTTELYRRDDVVEEQVLNGLVVKHYN